MRYRYDHNGQTHEIDIERLPDGRYKAVVDGRELTLAASQLADGAWLLRHEGQQHMAYVASADQQRYVQLDGGRFALQVNAGRRRQRSALAGGDLTAQMPGLVMAVPVAVGDAVTTGQTLVVLEAMKMEIRVTASADGVVQQLHVQVGDVVERGQTLIEVRDA